MSHYSFFYEELLKHRDEKAWRLRRRYEGMEKKQNLVLQYLVLHQVNSNKDVPVRAKKKKKTRLGFHGNTFLLHSLHYCLKKEFCVLHVGSSNLLQTYSANNRRPGLVVCNRVNSRGRGRACFNDKLQSERETGNKGDARPQQEKPQCDFEPSGHQFNLKWVQKCPRGPFRVLTPETAALNPLLLCRCTWSKERGNCAESFMNK